MARRVKQGRIEKDLMRGAGPVAVLKLLERGDMYGYQLVAALDQRTDGVLAMGQSTLYPLLYNLEAKGLIAAEWREGGPRPRKYYALTGKGRKRLAAQTEEWNRLAGAMAGLGILRSGAGWAGAEGGV